MKFSRRDFIATTALGSASLALDLQGQNKSDTNSVPSTKPKKPIIISLPTATTIWIAAMPCSPAEATRSTR